MIAKKADGEVVGFCGTVIVLAILAFTVTAIVKCQEPTPEQTAHERAEWLRSQARGYISLADAIDPPTPTPTK